MVYWVYVLKMKTIKVSEKVHEKLRERGKKGESFNSIIDKLLKEREQ